MEVVGRLAFLLYSISAAIHRYVARMTVGDSEEDNVVRVVPGYLLVLYARQLLDRSGAEGIAWYPPRQTFNLPRAPSALDKTASGLIAGKGERECP